MLFIYCAGGFGKEVYDIALRTGYDPSSLLFIDDSNHINSSKIINFDEFVHRRTPSDQIVIAHGEPKVRYNIFQRLSSLAPNYATLIDPSSIISPSATILPGSIICPFCSISSNAQLFENTVVNTCSIVGHDCVVESHSVISSMVNLGGATHVKNQVYIGMGALIRESLVLEDHCVISMGSVVHRDVATRHIVQGDPARSRMLNQDGKIFKR